MNAITRWMSLVFTLSSEPGWPVEEEGEEEEEEEEDVDQGEEEEVEEQTDYFPVILQQESMKEARGRLLFVVSTSCVVFTIIIKTKYIYSVQGTELSTLYILSHFIPTTILWIISMIILS